MAGLKYEYRDFLVLNFTDQPVIANPVAPQATFVSAQRLAELPGTVSRLQTLAQKGNDLFLDGTI
jgi:hypothetical protein